MAPRSGAVPVPAMEPRSGAAPVPAMKPPTTTVALSDMEGLVRRAFDEAVRGASLRAIVFEALPPLPPKRAVVRVIAIGKAAVPMMEGALDRWPDRVDRGLVVTVEPSSPPSLPDHVEILFASHPIPDARSVAAAERAIELVRGLGTADLFVALVSGGASSLVSAPPVGASLGDKGALVRDLLESGATIRDVNLVRRHASRIKGGRLAAAAAPARVLTLAVSDVIDGGVHDIGSGPTVPDPTTLDDARAVLRRHAPAWEDRFPLEESLKLDAAPRWRARVVAGPIQFAERLRDRLTRAGIAAPRVVAAEEGDAEIIAARRIEQARALAPGEAIVIPCEPTLRLPAKHGLGGRAGWIALRALASLPDDVVLLCGATDGTDGSSGSAGAIVSALRRAACDSDRVAAALAAFDDGPLHAALGSRIDGGATGVNFADVHVLARLR